MTNLAAKITGRHCLPGVGVLTKTKNEKSIEFDSVASIRQKQACRYFKAYQKIEII
jgi:hypothetical protein